MYLDLNKENEQAIYSTLADYFENYQPEEERAALSAMHEYCLQSVDSAYYYPVCQWIDQEYHGDKQRMISAVFNKSLLTNKQRLLNYLDKPQEKILAEDPLLQLCRLLRKACRQAYADYSADQQQISELQQRYIEGLRLMQPDLYMRPDANFSLRFSYGKVAGYQPYDGTLFQYNTHLSGWLERHYTHNYSCITDSVFEHLCYLHPNQPVHFLTTCDATVNRMGNAVFNESGELSGMLIGGNAETVCNNYCYHAVLQRTIALDIRYITFLLREYIHADRLLEELCYAEAPRIIQPEATVIAADEIGTTTQADNAPTNEESTENSSR